MLELRNWKIHFGLGQMQEDFMGERAFLLGFLEYSFIWYSQGERGINKLQQLKKEMHCKFHFKFVASRPTALVHSPVTQDDFQQLFCL